ncbi:hypothetical protein [Ureibacillus thermophilus]|uniref:Uncharacterized protein n=1 Tax=Ureibacillus thermophilus TaxID=367743 RepID=A0A4P6UTB7_9BACL|nr:hypothetical protein [Ureibacillus thermophilus]QBK25296.1 hypothetical protein DKZ56_05140 [Ureibacillus thermophilus]
MAVEKLNIVPVKLESDSDSTSTSTSRGPLRPVCVIQATDLKISFYPGVKPHIIQTVIKELNRSDS